MRKLIFAVMAIVAIGFTACNNKTGQGPVIDSTSLIADPSPEELAGIDAGNLTTELKEKILTKNPEAVQAVLQKAKERIAELTAQGDTVAAKVYQKTISTYLKENAEQIKAVVGEQNDAVTTLITAIAAVPGEATEAAEGAVEAIRNDAEATVNDVKDQAKKKVDATVDEQKKKAAEAVEAQKKKAAGAIDDAANEAKRRLGL